MLLHNCLKTYFLRKNFTGIRDLSSSRHRNEKILYIGSDLFSIQTLISFLKKLKENDRNRFCLEDIEVLSNTTAVHKKGKMITEKSLLLEFAESEGLKSHLWQDVAGDGNFLKRFSFGVVASYGKLIPTNIIDGFTRGMLNVHPSLLPRWKGSSPVAHTILNGDHRTGVSIISVSPERFDQGSIYYQTEIKVPPQSSTTSLSHSLANIGGECLYHVLNNFDELHKRRKKQSSENSTLAWKIKPHQGHIDWESMTNERIDCMRRAFEEMAPLFTFYKNMKVKLLSISLASENIIQYNLSPGEGFYCAKNQILFVKCSDGWLKVQELRILNKKTITAKDFFNGYIKGSGNMSSCFQFHSNPTVELPSCEHNCYGINV